MRSMDLFNLLNKPIDIYDSMQNKNGSYVSIDCVIESYNPIKLKGFLAT